MSYSVCNSYEDYLKIRNTENAIFCSKYGYQSQSPPVESSGGGNSYQTANNVKDFVSTSTNSSIGHTHSSSNCVYRSLSG